MNNYELTVIISVTLDTAGKKKTIEKVEKLVTEAGGQVQDKNEWGKKSLAYRLKGETEGIYYFFKLSLPSLGVKKLTDKLKSEEKLLRNLLVRVSQ